MDNFEYRPAAAGRATTAAAKRRAKRAAKAGREAEQRRRALEARGKEEGPSAGAEDCSPEQQEEETAAGPAAEGAAEEGTAAKGLPRDGVPPNVFRVRTSSKIRMLVSRALAVLEEGNSPCVQIIGAGKAITKAVSVAEIVKRRNNGTLHQYTAIGTEDEVDEWVPKERELDTLLVTRHLPCISVYLSANPLTGKEQLGYQPPTAPAAFANDPV